LVNLPFFSYIAEPDHTMHSFGFYTGDLIKKLTELDQVWQYLMEKLTTSGLDRLLNVILTSDHGHSEVGLPFFGFLISFSIVSDRGSRPRHLHPRLHILGWFGEGRRHALRGRHGDGECDREEPHPRFREQIAGCYGFPEKGRFLP
jgi:hypothetical protein